MSELDYRALASFRNALYASQKLDAQARLPFLEFIRIRSNHENESIRNGIVGTEDSLISQIVDPSTGMIDLNKFSDIVDLFIYMPNRGKTN